MSATPSASRVTAATAAATAKANAPRDRRRLPGRHAAERSAPRTSEPPVVIGTLQVGQKLTSTAGTWTGSPTKFAYRWQRCDASGLHCVAIAKATHADVHDDARRSRLDARARRHGLGQGRLRVGPLRQDGDRRRRAAAAPLDRLADGRARVSPGTSGRSTAARPRRGSRAPSPSASRSTSTAVDQSLGLVGTGVSLSVPGLPSAGFKWPVEVDYSAPAPASTVLGYSTDGKVFASVPALGLPALARGETARRVSRGRRRGARPDAHAARPLVLHRRRLGRPDLHVACGPSLTRAETASHASRAPPTAPSSC